MSQVLLVDSIDRLTFHRPKPHLSCQKCPKTVFSLKEDVPMYALWKNESIPTRIAWDMAERVPRLLRAIDPPLRGFSQVNSTWKKWTSTRCCNRLDNKNFPCILRFPQRLKLSSLPFAAVHVAASIKDLRLNFFIMIIFWAVLTHVLQKEWQPCRSWRPVVAKTSWTGGTV